jgi:hypothetical protein
VCRKTRKAKLIQIALLEKENVGEEKERRGRMCTR